MVMQQMFTTGTIIAVGKEALMKIAQDMCGGLCNF